MNKTLISIDYLIVNLEGQIFGDFPDTSNFTLKHHEYGTKIFANRSDLYLNNEKIGSFMANPRSEIMSKEFAQLQFENHLFYTKTLEQLGTILQTFCDETKYYFKSINRLDICLDKNDSDNGYRDIYNNIINGTFLISGRPKNIQSYFETFKGVSILNGFQLGKRTSEKLLRVYNKSLSLQLTEKPYIDEFFKNNGLKNSNIWRFEYQLNSKFFRDLERQTSEDGVKEKLTYGIFQLPVLFELLKRANSGYFDLHENTGKSQINKERKIDLFDFDNIKQSYTTRVAIVSKISNKIISTSTVKKRLAKSLFREYYCNQQDISYIVALNHLLENIDFTGKKMIDWFNNKVLFYLHEFRTKEKINQKFDKEMFFEHQTLFL